MTQVVPSIRPFEPDPVWSRGAPALAIRMTVFGLFAIVTGCADLGNGGRPASATPAAAIIHSTKRLSTMSNEKVRIYDLYLAAWSDVPVEQRARMLRESVSEHVVFANPQQTRRGIDEVIEHLEGFQQRSPGGSFRINNMVGWADHGLAEWQLVDAEGKAGPSGYDVLTFDDQGLISSILLFGSVEAQKLAWRRRDPVALEPTN